MEHDRVQGVDIKRQKCLIAPVTRKRKQTNPASTREGEFYCTKKVIFNKMAFS